MENPDAAPGTVLEIALLAHSPTKLSSQSVSGEPWHNAKGLGVTWRVRRTQEVG